MSALLLESVDVQVQPSIVKLEAGSTLRNERLIQALEADGVRLVRMGGDDA
jgi:hypothetical protein